ncbi:cation:proton antiporter regulatory subunit [Scopulibacillus cellulosilyticus]|uniref:Cation:proton antiporter regulatory subunit n=1 Tax=Scopulibacillus cellulosilyticus TaxID=2665665 RepID=A0ABW2Q1F1_9BACL
MKIKTAKLPGIGYKISMITAEDSMLVLIVHHNGKRDLYMFEDADNDEPDFYINLTADETREIGAQLLGAIYQPVDVDKAKMFRKQIQIEWIELSKESQLVGKTIGDSEIRPLTGATVIGIVKGEDLIATPDIDVVLQAGDVIIAIGKQEQIEELALLCGEGEHH